jgi:hypothetical protein
VGGSAAWLDGVGSTVAGWEGGDSVWEGSDLIGGRGKGDLSSEREAAAGKLRQQGEGAGEGETIGADGEFILFGRT